MRATHTLTPAEQETAAQSPAAAAPQTTANINGLSGFALDGPISDVAGGNTSSPQIATAQRQPAKDSVYMTAVPTHALDGGGPPNPPVAEAPRQPNTEEYVFRMTPPHALDSGGQWIRKRDGAVVPEAEVDAWRDVQTRAPELAVQSRAIGQGRICERSEISAAICIYRSTCGNGQWRHGCWRRERLF